MTKTKNKQRQRQLIENKDKERQIRHISQPQAFQAGYGNKYVHKPVCNQI